MKRVIAILVVLACGNGEAPPRTEAEVTLPKPTASASATATANAEPSGDAGTSLWGDSLGELQQTNTAHGHLGGAHPPAGRLAPEVIQRIVRANFSSVKTCYEKGLIKDKALTGRVATRFVISESGDVSEARPDATTNLSSPEVVACIVAVFKSLKFPQPEGGIVTVVYPLNLAPSD